MRATALLKRTAAGIVMALAFTGAVAVSPSAAYASDDWTVRIAPKSQPGLFLDVSGASKDTLARVIQWPLTTGDNQIWTIRHISGTDYEFINKHSGKCMETDNVAGHQLFQAPCDGNRWQLWSYDKAQDGSSGYLIWNTLTNLYVDVYGASRTQGAAIDAWPFDGYDTTNYPFLQGPLNQEFLLLNA
ncbi:RICIN domain-containing protein [Dactylosporangium sp. CA-092794]|uniref:RICIN domain-containing protein n=1 Tax=Dactylosporangium sp. CA-092794 TaxID=3239929 RepID=UPI003D94EE4D